MTHTLDEAAARACLADHVHRHWADGIRSNANANWGHIKPSEAIAAMLAFRTASQAELKAETGRAEAIALAEQYAAARDWNGAYHALRIALNCSEPKAVGEDVVARAPLELMPNNHGRVEVSHADPLYKALRPAPETIAAIEQNERANAEGLAAIRNMMVGHVENWPAPKKFGTALALVDKALHAAIAATPPSPDPATIEREALERTMIGGNHLATVLIGQLGAGFAERYPPEMDPQDALRTLCATDTYEIWCCWRAIMLARASINKE